MTLLRSALLVLAFASAGIAQDGPASQPVPPKAPDAPEAPDAPKKPEKPEKPKPPASPYKIELKAKAAKVTLGDSIELVVTVTNTGKEAIQARPIRIGTHSTWVRLRGERWDSTTREYYLVRFVGGRQALSPQPQSALAPGASVTGSLMIPTAQAGKLKLAVNYNGHIPYPPGNKQIGRLALSNEVEVEVAPTKDGGKFAVAKLETTQGVIRFHFFDSVAPGHVRNFIELALKGYYDGVGFHRIIPGFMAQGGDPKGTGNGGPGYSIPAEFNPKMRHAPGIIAAARTSDPHSAGSQFYICLGSPSHLNGKYTIFGRVIEGMDAVKAMGQVPTSSGNKPQTPVTMKKVTIEYLKELPK